MCRKRHDVLDLRSGYFSEWTIVELSKFLEKITNRRENGSAKTSVTGFWFGVLPHFCGGAPTWGTWKTSKAKNPTRNHGAWGTLLPTQEGSLALLGMTVPCCYRGLG
jgi:hypothetical protein